MRVDERGGDGGRAGAPLTVTLTEQELLIAAMTGVVRRVYALCRDLQPVGMGDFNTDVQGACGEMAFAKFLSISNLSPDFMSDFGLYEVRTTDRPEAHLLVREKDSSARKYVLVIQESPTRYRIVGWTWGYEAKRPEWKGSYYGTPAYFVPQRALQEF